MNRRNFLKGILAAGAAVATGVKAGKIEPEGVYGRSPIATTMDQLKPLKHICATEVLERREEAFQNLADTTRTRFNDEFVRSYVKNMEAALSAEMKSCLRKR